MSGYPGEGGPSLDQEEWFDARGVNGSRMTGPTYPVRVPTVHRRGEVDPCPKASPVTRNRKDLDAVDTARACVQRVDHGEGPMLTLAEATEQVTPNVDNATRADLRVMVAYLACQVVGYQRARNADATLAMQQIGTVLKDYTARHGTS